MGISKRNPERHKQIIRDANKGKKLSEHTREKIRLKRKLQIITAESNLKRSETLKKGYEEGRYKIGNRGGWNRGKKCPEVSERQLGANSHFWKGGISFGAYSPEFNVKLKRIVKDRDKNRCLICKSQKRLCVHHINYDKKDCRPENLVTLCGSCHSRTNSNREQWLLFFKVPDTNRKYTLSFAMLCDRLAIVTLKSIKIADNKAEYEKEAREIMHDLDLLAIDNGIEIKEFGQLVRAIQVNMLINEMIWSNESRARKGEEQDLKLLKLTHSLNRIRNQAMNVISNIMGERKDLKLDYMDASLTKEFGYDFEGLFKEDSSQ